MLRDCLVTMMAKLILISANMLISAFFARQLG
jgi:hypothetical protein